MAANREYKDRLFKFIFGNPDHKEWTLSLYNAMNCSHYTDTSAIEFNTIESAVYMSMKNDVSFLIEDAVHFYEQQSTFNPNMPMRFLIYAGMAYSRYVEQNEDYNPYSSRQQTAPTPRCVCFYNGAEPMNDRRILRLSDAFRHDFSSDIEVTVTMININFGHNKALLESCRPLKEYAWFVDSVRKNQQVTDTLETAIDMALAELSDDSLIKPFLLANQAEVKYMCITEYDEQKMFARQRKEALEEGMEKGMEKGIEKGMEKGKLDMLLELFRDGMLTLQQAAEKAHMTVSEFEARAENYG